MTIYEQFRQALFKASPELEKEIKELKFGCLTQTKSGNNVLRGMIVGENSDGSFETQWGSFTEESLNVEIIGRDITLEDVLSILEGNEQLGDYHIGDGYFTMYKFDTENNEIIFNWKLGKPAHEQSEETLKSLIKLL